MTSKGRNRLNSVAVILLLIVLLASSTSAIKSPAWAASREQAGSVATDNVVIVPGTVSVETQIEDAVRDALKEAWTLGADAEFFAITDVQELNNWRFISVIGLKDLNADQEWNLLENGSWFGLVLLQKVGEKWISAMEGTPEFASALSGIPSSILDTKDKQYLDPPQYRRLQNVQYRFPWQFGTSMQYGILGVHENEFAVAVNGWKAVDLLSDGDTVAGHAPNRLLASAAGTISYKCTPNPGEFTTTIRIGDVMYTHLLDNGGLYVGRFFSQGEEMGQMKTGTFYENCGYANQGANWFHVHLGFPNTGSFTAGNWTLNFSDQIWRRDGEPRSIHSWLQAGGVEYACPHSGGVILYRHANYDCGGEASEYGHFISDNIGVETIPGSFNDQASSLHVPSGWSVRLFEHADRGGGRVCFSGGDLDLSGNLFDNGVPVNDNISSMEIFSEEICPPLYGPLSIESFTVNDDLIGESNGNGDAVVGPGETIELNVMLHNQGIETASNVEAKLTTSDPFVSVLENTVSTYQDILAGNTSQNTQDWELLIDPGATAGHKASICLDPITAGAEGFWSACFELEITLPESCDAYEPNNATSLSTPISYDGVINWSAICPTGDEDYFAFSGTAGDKVFADIDGQSYGSALDTHLALIDSNGTTILAQNDDEPGINNSTDSQLSYQLSHDGTYFLRVRAADHPNNGGPDHYYSIFLITDDAAPTVTITDPDDDAWLDPKTVSIIAAANDDTSGVQKLEFWWHENGQVNPYWTLLGEDKNSEDGWKLNFDTSVLPEQQSGGLRVRATDRLGNSNEDTSSNLGVDRTAPSSVAISPAVIEWLIVPITWTADDNLSGVSSVTLWVRKPGMDWRDTGLPAQSGTSGTFNGLLAFGSGTYEFATRAVDYAGNDEGKPLTADTSFYFEVPYSAYFSVIAKN